MIHASSGRNVKNSSRWRTTTYGIWYRYLRASVPLLADGYAPTNSLRTLRQWKKARLILLGHLQVASRDFKEIFAPVIKMESVRILLALIARFDMEFIQADVKTAFLYVPLDEVVYMRQRQNLRRKGRKDGFVGSRKQFTAYIKHLELSMPT